MLEHYRVGRCFTSRTWTDVGEPRTTGDKVRKVKDADEHIAHQKPGDPEAGSVRPIAEYIASVCGRWLDVPVPTIRLRDCGAVVALSCDVGDHIEWSKLQATNPLYTEAISKLQSFTGVVVLDLLVHLDDDERGKFHDNHIFCTSDRKWYSIDYAPSLWHPGYKCSITYQDALLVAMRTNPAPIAASLALAQNIPDGAIDELSNVLPDPSSRFPRAMFVEILRHSRNDIAPRVQSWCKANSISL